MNPEAEAFLRASAPLVGSGRPARDTDLPSQIAAALRERIQFGDLKPGDRIREVPTAAEFDVSRGPVRDALRILERDRIISIEGRAGAIVRNLSVDDLRAIFEIRAELSADNIRRAAEAPNRSAAQLDALQAGASVLAAIAGSSEASVSDYIQVRRRLGELVSRLSGNDYVGRIMLEFEREIAVPWAGVFEKPRQKTSSAAWRRIARAIRRGDGPAAEDEGRRIVLDSLEALLKRRTD